MTPRDRPRIAPVTRADADHYQAELFDLFGPGEPLHLFGTMAHHSKLLRDWLPLGGRLLYGGLLVDRDRELVILRTSYRCGSAYEWGQHVGIARGIGLSDDEILACAAPVPADPLTADDLAILAAVDELVDGHEVASLTWERLAGRLDDAELIELVMLVGQYVMLAGLLNSLGVQTERPLPAVGEVA